MPPDTIVSAGSVRLRVETWDGDLALRLPQAIVDALDLVPIGPRRFEIVKRSGTLANAHAEP